MTDEQTEREGQTQRQGKTGSVEKSGTCLEIPRKIGFENCS